MSPGPSHFSGWGLGTKLLNYYIELASYPLHMFVLGQAKWIYSLSSLPACYSEKFPKISFFIIISRDLTRGATKLLHDGVFC